MTFRPSFNTEKNLWKRGYRFVAGLDEAGVGPLAGPVVASAVVIVTAKFKIQNAKCKITPNKSIRDLTGQAIQNSKLSFNDVRDSKRLSPKKREQLYVYIRKCPDIFYGVGIISEKMIDKINIKNAAELAMGRALKQLEKKIRRKVDFLLVDGNRIRNLQLKTYNLKLIVKADEKVFSCAAASIIAKVRRDEIMFRLHKKYPQYGFDKHKGYPTKAHLAALKKYGPSKVHRMSFGPVRIAANQTGNVRRCQLFRFV